MERVRLCTCVYVANFWTEVRHLMDRHLQFGWTDYTFWMKVQKKIDLGLHHLATQLSGRHNYRKVDIYVLHYGFHIVSRRSFE
jgi:hypothetical protein